MNMGADPRKWAVEWLSKHDPNHVSPAEKAAVTRDTPYDFDALGELLEGVVTQRGTGDGVWRSATPIGFTGDAEAGTCTVEAIDPGKDVIGRLIVGEFTHGQRGSKRKRASGAKRRKARRMKKARR